MLFSSLIFLQAFLPLTLAAYYGIGLLPASSPEKKRRRKNAVLLLASLVFYGFSGLKYLLLMLAVILLNYFGGLLVSRGKTPGARKAFLAATVILNLGLLFYFKYFNLFRDLIGQIGALFGGEPEAFTRIILQSAFPSISSRRSPTRSTSTAATPSSRRIPLTLRSMFPASRS